LFRPTFVQYAHRFEREKAIWPDLEVEQKQFFKRLKSGFSFLTSVTQRSVFPRDVETNASFRLAIDQRLDNVFCAHDARGHRSTEKRSSVMFFTRFHQTAVSRPGKILFIIIINFPVEKFSTGK